MALTSKVQNARILAPVRIIAGLALAAKRPRRHNWALAATDAANDGNGLPCYANNLDAPISIDSTRR